MKHRIWHNLHTLKILCLFNNDWLRTCDILGQLYVFLITKLQNILFKNSHMKKWKKTKKDSHSFCKVIMLAPLCVPTPINHLVIPHLNNDIIVESNFKIFCRLFICQNWSILSCNTLYYKNKNIVPYINWCAQIYKFMKIFIFFWPMKIMS